MSVMFRKSVSCRISALVRKVIDLADRSHHHAAASRNLGMVDSAGTKGIHGMIRTQRLSMALIGAVFLIMSALTACSGGTDAESVETTTTEVESTTTTRVEDSREAVLLAKYAAASNAGDVLQAMRFFAPDPVVRRHPFMAGDYIDRSSEVRALEERVVEVRGSGTGIEFIDIVVAEGSSVSLPDVTFGWRFLYGADGIESGGEAGCIGGKDGKAFISNGLITEISWGFQDPSKCDI